MREENGLGLCSATRVEEHSQSVGAAVHGAIQGGRRGARKMRGALGRGHAFDQTPR